MYEFKANEKVYFIDKFDGNIIEGKFLEDDNSSSVNGGIWIKLSGQSANKFVFSDDISRLVYLDKNDAQKGLIELKSKLKSSLLSNNRFIEETCNKLSKHEGKLYSDIIKEILHEKIAP